MTTYHVKVTGTGGGAGSDGDPVREISQALTLCVAGGTSFESSADEVLVHYHASLTFGPLAAAIKRGVPIIGVDGNGIRWDDGLHYLTASDDKSGLYSRQQMPRIVGTAATQAIEYYEWQSWYGLDVDANSVSANPMDGTGTREVKAIDCRLRNGTAEGIKGVENNSILVRVRFEDCGSAAFYLAGKSIIADGCIADNCGGATATMGATGASTTLQNCGVYNCTGGAGRAFLLGAGGTGANCNAQDNTSAFGFSSAGTWTDCNAYSSSGAYHASGDFEGGTPATCTTVDSLFTAEGSDDYTLTPSSPLIGAGTTITGSNLDVDLDGTTWLDPPAGGPSELYDPPDARDRWDPQSNGLAKVTAGWTGTASITVDSVAATVGVSDRTSAAEVWADLLAECKRVHGESSSWEAWVGVDGKLTIVGEDLTVSGFDLDFTGNLEDDLGFSSSSNSGQLQYTANAAHLGAAANGLPIIADGLPHLATAEGATVADGSGTPTLVSAGGAVTLRIYDDTLAESIARVSLVSFVWDIVAAGMRIMGRMHAHSVRTTRRGESAGVPEGVAEIAGEAVAL